MAAQVVQVLISFLQRLKPAFYSGDSEGCGGHSSISGPRAFLNAGEDGTEDYDSEGQDIENECIEEPAAKRTMAWLRA